MVCRWHPSITTITPTTLPCEPTPSSRGTAIYKAVGAIRTIPTPPYPSTHNLGTNRMSADAKDGVVNKLGQSHDIKNLFVSDGSQFTSGAACNPTLTIVSLAIRQADTIASMMQRREV